MPREMTRTHNLLLMVIPLGSTLFVRASDKEMTISAIYLDAQGYCTRVHQGVQDVAKDSSVQVQLIETNAQGNVSKESTSANTPVERSVDAIILSVVSENGSGRIACRASEADILAICYNICTNQKGVDRYIPACLVGDPLGSGKKLGNAAADCFIVNKIDQPKTAVISCEAFEVCMQRRKGSEGVLKARILGTQIVANQEGIVLDKAISVGEKLITSMPDPNAITGESDETTLGAVKATHNQNQARKIAVFGSDTATEIARELENNQVLKVMVDISGKKMGDAVFVQTLKVINKQADGKKVIQVSADLHTKTENSKQWLATRIDGLP